MVELEIAVASLAGTRTARAHGADRVELCTALELGGLTPSQGLVEEAVATGIPVHVLVRCRPGGFVYDADEVDTMARETRALVVSGASGIVVGTLAADGSIDERSALRLLETARSAGAARVVFHRAIDRAADPEAVAARAAALGFDAVLTSGGASTAADGLAVLARMAVVSPVEVIAAGGVRPGDIPALAAAGVRAVHLSAKRPVVDEPSSVALGPVDGSSRFVTDAAVVAAARAAVDGAGRLAG